MYYCILSKKSTFLLLFGSNINAWKTKRPANSVSSTLSLFPDQSSSLSNRFEWLPTETLSKKSKFTVFWLKNQRFCCYSDQISTHKKQSGQQTLYLAPSFSSQNNLLHFQTVLSGCRQTICPKSKVLLHFDYKKSPILLLFGSDINAWKIKRPANSVSRPLSLSPEQLSSFFKPFWVVADRYYVWIEEF